MRRTVNYVLFAVAAMLVVTTSAFSQQDDALGPGLTEQQQRLSEKYDRLELLAGRLAELSGSTQPRRARLLREFVFKSRERDLSGRFDTVIEALRKQQLGAAADGQGELSEQLRQLLELLLQEDRDDQIEAERKRIAKYLAEVKRLIRLQRGVKSRTEGGDDQQEVTNDQDRAADATGSLSEQIKETDGSKESAAGEQGQSKASEETKGESGEQEEESGESKAQDGDSKSDKSGDGKSAEGEPGECEDCEKGEGDQGGDSNQNSKSQSQSENPSSDSESPSAQGSPEESPGDGQSQEQQQQNSADRAAERLQQAQQRMQQALDRLKDAQRNEATEAQKKALEELQQAKAELEKILRQLREEELERMLVLLEARFRKMLELQIVVYERTKELNETQQQTARHELEIACARLSRKELQIVREADRALVLLREDGTSVAFPEALEQAREDMKSVAGRLNDTKLATITQALEEDIIASLEEILAALQQALEELREQKAQQQQSGGQQQQEKPLVDQLAELRMIRALQMRINRRTTLFGNMIEGEQATDAELLEALDELALREERVYRATLDLHQGANR